MQLPACRTTELTARPRRARMVGGSAHARCTLQGVVRLVEAVASESRASNININCVLPGTIDTPANRAAMPNANVSQWVRPEHIAKILMFLTSSDADPIRGAAIPVYDRS